MAKPVTETAFTPLELMAHLFFRPGPLLIYKPMQNFTGNALKVEYRLPPTFENGFLKAPKPKDTGAFVVWAKQKAENNERGDPQFDWDNGITVKLGMPDITGILYGIECRYYKRKLYAREKNKETGKWQEVETNAVKAFHKFEDDNAALTYQLQPKGAIWGVTKPGKITGSISISLQEEIALRAYLQMMLQAMLLIGKR